MSKWKTVSIRHELINEIVKVLKTGRYRSISEFVSEAIRLRLEELLRVERIPVEKRTEPLATPVQLLYTPKHTWAQMIPDGNIRVGVSDYAQRQLKGKLPITTNPVEKKTTK